MDTPLFERQEPTMQMVSLADIAPWNTSGAKSVTGKAVAALGLASTVLLRLLAAGLNYRYSVVDGAGRLDNAKAQSLMSVPAMVLAADVTDMEVAALRATMNLQRRANPMQEAAALELLLESLQGEGIPEAEVAGVISKTLGISVSVIRQRLGLLSLPVALRAGVETGKVARGVAAKIANLSPTLQAQLEEKLTEEGKLTAADVKAVRRVRQEETVAALPEGLFAPLETPFERARVAIENFLAEGVEATQLISLVEQLGAERQVA